MKISDMFRRKTPTAGTHLTYGLTPLGKTKAESFTNNTPSALALSALNENGVSSVAEIADELKTSPEKIKAILRGLIKSGYVRRVSQED